MGKVNKNDSSLDADMETRVWKGIGKLYEGLAFQLTKTKIHDQSGAVTWNYMKKVIKCDIYKNL